MTQEGLTLTFSTIGDGKRISWQRMWAILRHIRDVCLMLVRGIHQTPIQIKFYLAEQTHFNS